MKKNKKNSQVYEIWKRLKKNKAAMVGLVIISIAVFFAIFAPVFADYEKDAIGQNMSLILQKPNLEHPFGADEYGRDVFARIIFGARISLAIGVVATLAALLMGAVIGALSGYYGGLVDTIIMRFCDVIACIPSMLLCLAMVAALGPGIENMLVAIVVSMTPSFIRLTRSVVLTVVGCDYIEAAKACGTSTARIIRVHVLPNAMGPIIVQGTMSISGMILFAAGLSYIGMGVQPPTPEWGAMLANANSYLMTRPYLVVIPGVVLVLTALAFNLVGDGLRDALDPKLKN